MFARMPAPLPSVALVERSERPAGQAGHQVPAPAARQADATVGKLSRSPRSRDEIPLREFLSCAKLRPPIRQARPDESKPWRKPIKTYASGRQLPSVATGQAMIPSRSRRLEGVVGPWSTRPSNCRLMPPCQAIAGRPLHVARSEPLSRSLEVCPQHRTA